MKTYYTIKMILYIIGLLACGIFKLDIRLMLIFAVMLLMAQNDYYHDKE